MIQDPFQKYHEFWESLEGKKILTEERQKVFSGEKDTISAETVDSVFRKLRKITES